MPKPDINDTARRGAYHLAGDPSLYQPVRTNNFSFLVDVTANSPLASLVRVNSNPEDPDSYFNGNTVQETLNFSVVKFDAPHFSQEEIELKRGNSRIYFAGLPSFKEGSLVINDLMGADGKSIILAWQALSYDLRSDTIPSSEKYKTNATVNEYLPDGRLIRSWDLYGCWVKSVSEDGWDNEGGGKKTVTASIRFDKAVERFGWEG